MAGWRGGEAQASDVTTSPSEWRVLPADRAALPHGGREPDRSVEGAVFRGGVDLFDACYRPRKRQQRPGITPDGPINIGTTSEEPEEGEKIEDGSETPPSTNPHPSPPFPLRLSTQYPPLLPPHLLPLFFPPSTPCPANFPPSSPLSPRLFPPKT